MGHDVAFYANWGVQGVLSRLERDADLPGDGEWGNRTMVACAAHHADGDDCQIIALCDAWVLNPSTFPKDLRMAVWAPVDHWPLPPPSDRCCRIRVTPIAMSRFGERMMDDAGLEPLYVPHGVETDVFRPRRRPRRSSARR
jgi:hypothetical protein